jgi:hypothetical protein
MSQENLEIVRSVWAAFERFDFPAEAFAERRRVTYRPRPA